MSWLQWSIPTFLDNNIEAQKALVSTTTGVTLVLSATVPLVMHDLTTASSIVAWSLLVIGHLMVAWHLPVLLEERRKVKHAIKPRFTTPLVFDEDIVADNLVSLPDTYEAA